MSPKSVLMEKSQVNKVQQKIKLPIEAKAPILENQIVGSVLVTVDNKKITEYPIMTVKDVKEINFFSALKKVLVTLITF